MNSEQPIVLIDDDGAHRMLFKRALRKSQIANPVIEAESLQSARGILLDGIGSLPEPAIIVLDLNLRDGRGTTLLAELRAQQQFKGTCIIVLSTSALESDIRESYERGANCFITKSVDLNQFLNEVGHGIAFFMMQSRLGATAR